MVLATFIHDWFGWPVTVAMTPLCECGCGDPVAKSGNRFIHNHHWRGVKRPETTRLKMSVSQVGNQKSVGKNIGEDNGSWQGEKVGYHALHDWVRYWKVPTGTCEECGASPGYGRARGGTQWANVSGEYRRDLDDFRELCPGCNSAEKIAA